MNLVFADDTEMFCHSLDTIIDLAKRDKNVGISGPIRSILSSNICLSTIQDY